MSRTCQTTKNISEVEQLALALDVGGVKESPVDTGLETQAAHAWIVHARTTARISTCPPSPLPCFFLFFFFPSLMEKLFVD
jgi:hypothetical protein